MLSACADLLETFGGHELAAGFTIHEQCLGAFRRRVVELAAQWKPEEQGGTLCIDVTLPNVRLLSLQNVEDLRALEPFGAGNPRPTFLLEQMTVESCTGVGGGRHTRMLLSRDGERIDAIFFSMSLSEMGLQPGIVLDVAFFPQINEFRGERTVQLLVTDLRRSISPAQRDLRLYRRYVAGEALERWELEQLIPERRNFVALWRYLVRSGEAGLVEAPTVLSRNVARFSGLEQSCAATMICLEVFRERGLIDLSVGTRTLTVRVRDQGVKVNLDESAVLRRLRRLLG